MCPPRGLRRAFSPPFTLIPLTPSFTPPLSVYAPLPVLFSAVPHQQDKDWLVQGHTRRQSKMYSIIVIYYS